MTTSAIEAICTHFAVTPTELSRCLPSNEYRHRVMLFLIKCAKPITGQLHFKTNYRTRLTPSAFDEDIRAWCSVTPYRVEDVFIHPNGTPNLIDNIYHIWEDWESLSLGPPQADAGWKRADFYFMERYGIALQFPEAPWLIMEHEVERFLLMMPIELVNVTVTKEARQVPLLTLP